jgi:hypothetical protein
MTNKEAEADSFAALRNDNKNAEADSFAALRNDNKNGDGSEIYFPPQLR